VKLSSADISISQAYCSAKSVFELVPVTEKCLHEVIPQMLFFLAIIDEDIL